MTTKRISLDLSPEAHQLLARLRRDSKGTNASVVTSALYALEANCTPAWEPGDPDPYRINPPLGAVVPSVESQLTTPELLNFSVVSLVPDEPTKDQEIDELIQIYGGGPDDAA